MQLGNTTVYTPYDDDPGVNYEPDWRHQAAKIWNSRQGIICKNHKLANDRYVSRQHHFLKNNRRTPLGIDYRPYLFAFMRYDDDTIEAMKPRLEALLLTAVPYSVIAQDLGDRLTEEDIRTYERVYFNVRDERGRLNESCYLRTRFAMPVGADLNETSPIPVLWKVTANVFGYTGLVRLWKWSGVHGELMSDDYISQEMYRQAQAEMLSRILSHDINSFDLTQFLGHTVDRQRLDNELGSRTDKTTQAQKALGMIFAVIGPRMRSSARLVDVQKEQVKLLEAKFAAQHNIAGYKVQDAGTKAAEEALLKDWEEKFKNTRAEK